MMNISNDDADALCKQTQINILRQIPSNIKWEEKGNIPGTTMQIPQSIRSQTKIIQTYTTHKYLDNDNNT